MKEGGVPVLLSVATIFCATMALLPMPLTTRRPFDPQPVQPLLQISLMNCFQPAHGICFCFDRAESTDMIFFLCSSAMAQTYFNSPNAKKEISPVNPSFQPVFVPGIFAG